jgi:beta-N-acetylhexosaminidase
VAGSIARGIGAAVATIAVTATVVAAGTGALVVYRSATAGSEAGSREHYPSPSDGASTATATATTATASATPAPSASPTPPVRKDTRTTLRGPFRCPSAKTMNLRAAVAQTLMIGVSGANTSGPRGITDGPTPVGGIFLYSSSHDLAFTSGILRSIAAQSPPPLVAVDDEGGSVQRVDRLYGPLPGARQQGAMDPAALRRLAAERAAHLAAAGVTLNFAPVLDLGGGSGAVAADRTFAVSPDDVAASGAAFAAGMREHKVLPGVGHFPGIGRATGDPATQLPVTPNLSSLRSSDLVPFQRVLDDGPTAVLVANAYVPGLSSRAGLATALDPATYRLLRGDLGFTGLAVASDVSGQPGIQDKYSTGQATVLALVAGADLVILNHPGYLEPLFDEIVAAVQSGKLPESRVREAAARVLATKGCRA